MTYLGGKFSDPNVVNDYQDVAMGVGSIIGGPDYSLTAEGNVQFDYNSFLVK